MAADRVVGVGPVEDVDRQRCPDVDQPQRAGVVVVAAEAVVTAAIRSTVSRPRDGAGSEQLRLPVPPFWLENTSIPAAGLIGVGVPIVPPSRVGPGIGMRSAADAGAASSTTAKAAASTTARACRLFLNNGISVYLRGSEMTSVTLGAGPGLWNQANP